jgi:hypothetical protein
MASIASGAIVAPAALDQLARSSFLPKTDNVETVLDGARMKRYTLSLSIHIFL